MHDSVHVIPWNDSNRIFNRKHCQPRKNVYSPILKFSSLTIDIKLELENIGTEFLKFIPGSKYAIKFLKTVSSCSYLTFLLMWFWSILPYCRFIKNKEDWRKRWNFYSNTSLLINKYTYKQYMSRNTESKYQWYSSRML